MALAIVQTMKPIYCVFVLPDEDRSFAYAFSSEINAIVWQRNTIVHPLLHGPHMCCQVSMIKASTRNYFKRLSGAVQHWD
jgi:hypothetical protein